MWYQCCWGFFWYVTLGQGKWFPTFWRHIVPSFSSGCPMKMKTMCSFETSEQLTQCHSVIFQKTWILDSYMYEVVKSVSCNTACFYTIFMLNTNPTGCVNISSEKKNRPHSHAVQQWSMVSSQCWYMNLWLVCGAVIVGKWCIVSATRVIGQFFFCRIINLHQCSEWRHHNVLENQLVLQKRTSAQSAYSRVRLHVSNRC